MPQIEGFRIQNYRALKDVTLGKTSAQQQREPLTPFTAVIGKNGTGKSTLFDAFGFVADCLSLGVEAACEAHQRGGFDRLRSVGSDEPIRFELYYREAANERPITYELAIGLDRVVFRRPYGSFVRLSESAARSSRPVCPRLGLQNVGTPRRRHSSRRVGAYHDGWLPFRRPNQTRLGRAHRPFDEPAGQRVAELPEVQGRIGALDHSAARETAGAAR